jgi:antitoxin component YwqK of YwqJK toxin-antitoxin module
MRRVPRGELDYDARDGLHYLGGEPFTGIAFTVAPGAEWTKSEVSYQDGLRWGGTREWYAPGVLMVESSFLRDVLHGRAREWHRNGKLAEDGEYAYGIALWARTWDEEGRMLTSRVLEASDPAYARLLDFRRIYG